MHIEGTTQTHKKKSKKTKKCFSLFSSKINISRQDTLRKGKRTSFKYESNLKNGCAKLNKLYIFSQ